MYSSYPKTINLVAKGSSDLNEPNSKKILSEPVDLSSWNYNLKNNFDYYKDIFKVEILQGKNINSEKKSYFKNNFSWNILKMPKRGHY